jgi:hypothetical protein
VRVNDGFLPVDISRPSVHVLEFMEGQRPRSVSKCRSFTEIIAMFPSLQALADGLGIPVSTVRSWSARNSIPVAHWHDLVAASMTCGVRHLTLQKLNAIILYRETKSDSQQRSGLRSQPGLSDRQADYGE